MRDDTAFMELRLNRRQMMDGKVIDVYKDRVQLPSGVCADREVVEHPGAVAILAMDGDHVVLVKQYRYAIGEVLLELPAGKLECNETPIDTAKRELLEETGYVAKNWRKLTQFFTAPGFCNELIYLFQASKLSFKGMQPDEDEHLATVRVRRTQFIEMCNRGDIRDGKTLVAQNWL